MKKAEGKESTRSDILELIKSLTGQNNVLTIPVEFIHYTGSIDAALFLSQLLYWTGKGKRTDGFIYKTYKEWKDEIYLGEYEIRKARRVLEQNGVLETKVKRANGNPTVHYRLDAARFSESLLEFLKNRKASNSNNDSLESAESLTEATPETIAENTSPLLVSPDGDEKVEDKKGEFKDKIDTIGNEIYRRLLMIVPLIPNFKTERKALRSLAEEVYLGTCSINDVILCADGLRTDEFRSIPVLPTTVYRELGTFLGTYDAEFREFLRGKSNHPELYLIEEDEEYDDYQYDDDDDVPY